MYRLTKHGNPAHRKADKRSKDNNFHIPFPPLICILHRTINNLMRIFFSFFFLGILISCGNNANDKSIDDSTRIRQLPVDSNDVDIVELSKEDLYTWKVNSDEKTIRKNQKLGDDVLSVDTLIIGLNEMNSNVQLEKIKQSNDTLYMQIKNANFLTEQMGSAGSEAYIAQAVLNLTSANGVKYVKIDFEPGSHAMPDVWSKENFKEYNEVQ